MNLSNHMSNLASKTNHLYGDNYLFSEMYVEYPGEREGLKQIIGKLFDVKLGDFGDVDTDVLDINVKRNELFNSPKYGSPIPPDEAPNRYMYYKYRLDIVPISEKISKDSFVSELQKLQTHINELGFKVVADPRI